jgi:hypothetical protein
VAVILVLFVLMMATPGTRAHAVPRLDTAPTPAILGRLVSDSGVSATEARGLLDRFDAKSGADASHNQDSRQLAIKVPGKVDAVFLTTQRGFRNVEIVFPAVPGGQKGPTHADTQVWLLKADGTAVTRTEKAPEIVTISNAGHDQARAIELEIRVLSFEIVGLGPSTVPAFARVSFLATVRARRR